MADIDNLFSSDGLVHTAPETGEKRSKTMFGRREIINEVSYKDAAVCLNCTMEECEGERGCFKLRRKLLDIPDFDFDIPDFDFDIPDFDFDLPDFDFDLPDFDADFSIPENPAFLREI